ncbi:MAG: VOC family protein [Sphingomonas sp.]|uniref:VOC family protein n=1 Tax=Sphingomonas sp. TaxID=28214 RepID=UPI0035654927
MAKAVFINLPVADVAASTAFYEAIGCIRDARFSNDAASAMIWSDTISFMLLGHAFYQGFTPKTIIDAKTTSGALFALPFDTREEVDAFAARALAAGGHEAHGAEDLGFLYSRGIEDPDGHGLGPFWMDPTHAGGETDPTLAETSA